MRNILYSFDIGIDCFIPERDHQKVYKHLLWRKHLPNFFIAKIFSRHRFPRLLLEFLFGLLKQSVVLRLLPLPFLALPREVPDLKRVPTVLKDATPEPRACLVEVPLIVPAVKAMKVAVLFGVILLIGLRLRLRPKPPSLECVEV